MGWVTLKIIRDINIVALFVMIVCLIVAGCINDTRFDPPKNKYNFEINFYNTRAEVQEICNSKSADLGGCFRGSTIHVLKNRMCMIHEIEHAHSIFGFYHGDRNVSCKVLKE